MIAGIDQEMERDDFMKCTVDEVKMEKEIVSVIFMNHQIDVLQTQVCYAKREEDMMLQPGSNTRGEQFVGHPMSGAYFSTFYETMKVVKHVVDVDEL